MAATTRSYRRTPTHVLVGDIGKFVHYKEHTKGIFSIDCTCGYELKFNVAVDKAGDVKVDIWHRSKERHMQMWGDHVEDAFVRELLLRFDQVTTFKNCTQPWWA